MTPLEPEPRPPLLVLAVGNPSRGDDALGPLLLEGLTADGLAAQGDVELLTDFQLQVEHALDLEGRQAVLFVDAARPGAAAGLELSPLQTSTRMAAHSHALSPPEVLQVALRLTGTTPPAWQLALEGQCFDLGAEISPLAHHHLEQARPMVREWVCARRADMARGDVPGGVSGAQPLGAGGSVRTIPARAAGD